MSSGPKTPQQPHPSHQAAYLAACVACSWSEVLLPFTASTISSKDSGTICVGMIQSDSKSELQARTPSSVISHSISCLDPRQSLLHI